MNNGNVDDKLVEVSFQTLFCNTQINAKVNNLVIKTEDDNSTEQTVKSKIGVNDNATVIPVKLGAATEGVTVQFDKPVLVTLEVPWNDTDTEPKVYYVNATSVTLGGVDYNNASINNNASLKNNWEKYGNLKIENFDSNSNWTPITENNQIKQIKQGGIVYAKKTDDNGTTYKIALLLEHMSTYAVAPASESQDQESSSTGDTTTTDDTQQTTTTTTSEDSGGGGGGGCIFNPHASGAGLELIILVLAGVYLYQRLRRTP